MSGKAAELAGLHLDEDRERQLHGCVTDRFVQQLVDRCLPFQLPGPSPVHIFDPRPVASFRSLERAWLMVGVLRPDFPDYCGEAADGFRVFLPAPSIAGAGVQAGEA